MDVLPESARRLFPGVVDRIDLERHGAFVIARLLEEGDSADLAWLVDRSGAKVLRDWLAERGARQLSRRSLAFWEKILDVSADAQVRRKKPLRREELWPL